VAPNNFLLSISDSIDRKAVNPSFGGIIWSHIGIGPVQTKANLSFLGLDWDYLGYKKLESSSILVALLSTNPKTQCFFGNACVIAPDILAWPYCKFQWQASTYYTQITIP